MNFKATSGLSLGYAPFSDLRVYLDHVSTVPAAFSVDPREEYVTCTQSPLRNSSRN